MEEAAQALKTAGVNYLYLAGRPGDREDACRKAGVDAFVFAGCDLLALLKDAFDRLETQQGVEPKDLEVQS